MQKYTIININCQQNAYLESIIYNEHNKQKIGEMQKALGANFGA